MRSHDALVRLRPLVMSYDIIIVVGIGCLSPLPGLFINCDDKDSTAVG